MANYAYYDKERKQKIQASNPDIIKYKGKRCYCKNKSCDAHMYIHDPEHPKDAYFQSHGQPGHNGSCGITETKHFDPSKFVEKQFDFLEVMQKLEVPTVSKPSGTKGTGNGDGNNIVLSTVKQIYNMCTNTPEDEKYNGKYIWDMLADDRSFHYYKEGIDGYKLAECNYYQYDASSKSLIMNFPCFPDKKYYIQIQFDEEALYKEKQNVFYKMGHFGIIVIAGHWKKVNYKVNGLEIKAHCLIHDKKQIAVMKKETK